MPVVIKTVKPARKRWGFRLPASLAYYPATGSPTPPPPITGARRNAIGASTSISIQS